MRRCYLCGSAVRVLCALLTFTAPIERIRYKKKGSYEDGAPWRLRDYLEAQREYAFMLKLEGFTHRQIGYRLGIPTGSVSATTRVYRKVFKTKLERNMRRCRFVVSTHD